MTDGITDERIGLPRSIIDQGWPAFAALAEVLATHRLPVEQFGYVHHREWCGVVWTRFERLRT